MNKGVPSRDRIETRMWLGVFAVNIALGRIERGVLPGSKGRASGDAKPSSHSETTAP
jgi:hypothetical protein